jgi:hypothetical protein
VPTSDTVLFLDGLAGVRAVDAAALSAEVWTGAAGLLDPT